MNPVRAKRTARAEDWPWSSAPGHVTDQPDGLTVRPPFLDDGKEWRRLLRRGTAAEEMEAMRTRTRTGPPLGAPGFVERLERTLGRVLRRKKPGTTPAAKPCSAKRKAR